MNVSGMLTTLSIAALVVSLAQAGDSPEKVAQQWCAACHTATGNSISQLFPRIAGQKQNYIVGQLKEFRSKNRSDEAAHDYMWGVARTLDDSAIDGVARYFAAQKPLPNPRQSDNSLVSAGKEIYLRGIPAKGASACVACHGDNGQGTEIAPRLAGQHAAYFVKQMHVFETLQRPSAAAMQGIVKSLSDDDVRALAAYAQSL